MNHLAGFLIGACGDMALFSDPYVVLGVPRDASDAEIARARRRLSRRYDPEENDDPDAAERSAEVELAFRLLSNREARAEYDRTGVLPRTARIEWDRDSAAEMAPGIFVQPPAVDFGVIDPRRPMADAAVIVDWTGAPPEHVRGDPGKNWWRTLRAEMRDSSHVVFYLRAQAHAEVPNGPQEAQFTVTLDDTSVAVPLTAEIWDVVRPPAPADSDTAVPVPPAPKSTRKILAGVVLVLAFLAGMACLGYFVSHAGGGTAAPPTPPVKPVKVAQAREAALDVRPVFAASTVAPASAKDLTEGIAGPPVQQGLEVLLPVAPQEFSNGELPSFCVIVTVPESDNSVAEAGAAGQTISEWPIGTVAVHGGKALAFPALIPGSYALYSSCLPTATSVMTLGTVTVGNLGVVEGAAYADPGNAMVIFAAHTSGATTTLTYGAIGGTAGALVPSLTPVANDACIDSDNPTTNTHTYWQPTQSLVSQQVAGTEWLQTGTLVFHSATANPPQGNFYYNCAEDIPQGPFGFAIPIP